MLETTLLLLLILLLEKIQNGLNPFDACRYKYVPVDFFLKFCS